VKIIYYLLGVKITMPEIIEQGRQTAQSMLFWVVGMRESP
jgi:hypothetical protein